MRILTETEIVKWNQKNSGAENTIIELKISLEEF